MLPGPACQLQRIAEIASKVEGGQPEKPIESHEWVWGRRLAQKSCDPSLLEFRQRIFQGGRADGSLSLVTHIRTQLLGGEEGFARR